MKSFKYNAIIITNILPALNVVGTKTRGGKNQVKGERLLREKSCAHCHSYIIQTPVAHIITSMTTLHVPQYGRCLWSSQCLHQGERNGNISRTFSVANVFICSLHSFFLTLSPPHFHVPLSGPSLYHDQEVVTMLFPAA